MDRAQELEAARAAVEALVQAVGPHVTFPFDYIWQFAQGEIPISKRRPHLWRSLVKEGYLEATDLVTRASSTTRKGSPTRTYRLGPKFRPVLVGEKLEDEVALLLEKSLDSLILAVEMFNRPWDRGRVTAVLILFDHAFEMFLKAALSHLGANIHTDKHTIGFDECVRKALSHGVAKFLDEDQAIVLRSINGLRDAAQHYLIDVPEHLLYLHAQSGLTVFKQLLYHVFRQQLHLKLPRRVLPISTEPPEDLLILFEDEVASLRQVIRAGQRNPTEATARLRALAVVENAIHGKSDQPTHEELTQLQQAVEKEEDWKAIFPGISSINITANGYGPSFELKITKRDGIPVHIVGEEDPTAALIAIKRVNELDFYSLGLTDLATKLGITAPKATAVARYLNLQEDPDCCKEIKIGKTSLKRYSKKALDKMREIINTIGIEEVWRTHGQKTWK